MHSFRKFRMNQKGGMSIAIAVIMSLVVFSSFTQSVLLYDQQLRNEDRERLEEKLDILSVRIVNGTSLMNVALKNIGGVSTRLVSLWLNNTRFTIDLVLELQQIKMVVIDVTPNIPNPNSTQTITVFTKRGSSGSETYTFVEPEGPSWDIGATGVFKVDWFYSKYSSKQHPIIRDAIMISKSEDYVAFYVNVTNQWKYPCNITEQCFLTLTSMSTIGASQIPIFFIVKNVTRGTTPTLIPFQEIKVYPGESALLCFAAYTTSANWKQGGTWNDWKWGPQCFTQEQVSEGAGIQISLFYYNSTVKHVFGQTISTQAVILLDGSITVP